MGLTQETSLNIYAHFGPITCYQDYHQSCQEHITNYLSGRSPPLLSRVSGGLSGGPQQPQALDLRRSVPSGGGGYINTGKLFSPCLTPWRHRHRPRQPFSMFLGPWRHHPHQSFSLCDTAAQRRGCPHPGCRESWGTSNGNRWSPLKVTPALLRDTTFLEKMPPLQQRNLLFVMFECFPFHCFIIV